MCWYKRYRDGSDMDFALEKLSAETSIGNRRPHKVKYQRQGEKIRCKLMSVSKRKWDLCWP